MTDASDNDAENRLQNLELKVMDLEVTIEKLNESLIRLYQDSQESRDMLHRLQDKVATLVTADESADSDPRHEKPPHY